MTLQSGAAETAQPAYPRFLDAGETALVIEFGDSVDPAINAQVLALDAALRSRPPKGAREFVPTYRSLMIHYEPLEINRGELIRIARKAMAASAVTGAEGATWIFPCCYELPFSEDLDQAAGLLKLSRDELIALHTTATLRSICTASRRASSISAACRRRSRFQGVRSRGRRIPQARC